MQVSDIRDAIEVKLRDTNNQILTDAQILDLLNEAQEEWALATNEVVQLNGYASVASQFDYAAPSDFVRLRQAWWVPLRGLELEVVNDYEWSEMGGMDFPSNNYPRAAREFREGASHRIQFWPPPHMSSEATTLNGGINDSVTTITVTDATVLRSPSGYIQIENEKILYQNVSGNNLLLCRRGVMGTTAASHSNAVAVTQLDLLISYARLPAELTGDTSVPEIHIGYHSDLQWYVLYHALILDGRPEASQGYLMMWEKVKKEAAALSWKKQAASPVHRTRSPYGP